MTDTIYDMEVQGIDGAPYNLDRYRGKVLLVVNTASQCGFTPQYAGLEKLHQEYEAKGLVILGFPCNQFGQQEPGTNEAISSFCQLNFGVTFAMHQKVEVNGSGAHPLFKLLTEQVRGILGTKKIKWNFTKFLVDQNGTVLKRYAPNMKPKELISDIEGALGN